MMQIRTRSMRQKFSPMCMMPAILRNWLMGKVNFKKRLSDLLDRIKNTLNPSGEKALNDVCDSAINNKVVYNDVKPLGNQLTTNEIIQRLGGGDLTGGSCSSLAFRLPEIDVDLMSLILEVAQVEIRLVRSLILLKLRKVLVEL